MTLGELKDMAGDDLRVLFAIDIAEQQQFPNGGDRVSAESRGSSATSGVRQPVHGSRQHQLRVLRGLAVSDPRAKHALEQVLAGKLAPSTAVIELGKRPRQLTVNISKMSAAAKSLRARLTPEQRQELARLLLEAETPEG